jgi:hypothetical protein
LHFAHVFVIQLLFVPDHETSLERPLHRGALKAMWVDLSVSQVGLEPFKTTLLTALLV